MNEGQFKVIGDYLCIRMPKEIDHHNAEILSKTVDAFIYEKKVNNIVFDFQLLVLLLYKNSNTKKHKHPAA